VVKARKQRRKSSTNEVMSTSVVPSRTGISLHSAHSRYKEGKKVKVRISLHLTIGRTSTDETSQSSTDDIGEETRT
jgi:hypothetical protein